MKIDKLYIENFKGIKNAQPNLGDLTIITGKNSSGKSSIIQALKYITQWINRIERTRDLGPFSFPALNIFHPDFINENRDYNSVLNSLSKTEEGIVLGFDSQFQDKSGAFDEGLHFKAYFENIAKEGELVRPIKFDIRSDNFGDEEIQNYEILYSDENSLENLQKRNDFARKFYLGHLLSHRSTFAEWNFDNYMTGAVGGPGGYFVDLGGKIADLHYLHEYIYEEIQDLKKEIIPILIGDSLPKNNLNEDAIALNTNSERISFNSSQNLKMSKYGSEKNYFFDLFSNYISFSLEHHTKNTTFNSEKEVVKKFYENIKSLEDVIKRIFKYITPILDSKYRQTFLNYIQHDLASKDPNEGDVELGGPNAFIKGLNKELIKDLKVETEIEKKFTMFANWINKQKDPEYYLMITQIVSMFFIYFYSLSTNNSKETSLNRSVSDFLDDNDIFTDEQSLFIMRSPIEKTINCQNLLGSISKNVGHLKSDDIMARSSDYCGCYLQNFNVFDGNDFIPRRDIGVNEVVRPCPRGSQIVEHIYRLTSYDEIKDQEPNDYTQYPVANFRAYNMKIATDLLYELEKLYFTDNNINSKTDKLFKLLFSQLEEEKKALRSKSLDKEQIDKEQIFTSQKSKSFHPRSTLDRNFNKLNEQLNKISNERWDLESSLEEKLHEYERARSLRKKNSNVLNKIEKDIEIIEENIERLYKKETSIKYELNDISENIFKAKEFYSLSSEIPSVPESLSEEYEAALRKLNELESGLKFELQKSEKLRLENQVLRSKRKSLLSNKDQSYKNIQKLKFLNLEYDANEIEIKVLDNNFQGADKEIHKLKKQIKDLERKIDLSIAKGSTVKNNKRLTGGKLNKELENFEANYKGYLFNVDTIVSTTYIEMNKPSNSFNLNELSSNVKFLNTGRSTSPNQLESPGAFYENLPVGKFGGMLADVIYSQSTTPIAPFLYPSNEKDEPDRSIDGLTWEISHGDEGDTIYFESALNKWIKYLGLEVTEVKGVMEGPTPVLKVKGKDNVERNIFEVGSGVGQVLPVLAICLLAKPGDIVCIEEPEAHLHPSAQAYLSDFLISMSASGRQIIVETHSPNIIDRLRLRKAHKKSWNRLKNRNWIKNDLYLTNPNIYGTNFIEPEIRITYADQDSSGVSLYSEATINNSGDILFRDRQQALWPEGFFDTAQEEISRIIEARSLFEEE